MRELTDCCDNVSIYTGLCEQLANEDPEDVEARSIALDVELPGHVLRFLGLLAFEREHLGIDLSKVGFVNEITPHPHPHPPTAAHHNAPVSTLGG